MLLAAVAISGLLGFLAGRSSIPDSFTAVSDRGLAVSGVEERRLGSRAPGLKCDARAPFTDNPEQCGLIAPIQVASFEGPSIVPSFYKHVIIELGANFLYTVRDSLLNEKATRLGDRAKTTIPRLPLPLKSVYLLSFEPQLHKYAQNLASFPTDKLRKGTTTPMVGQHHPQGVILPFAVGPTDGTLSLHVSSGDACSSTMPFSDKASAMCKGMVNELRVPSVSLRTVLGWISPDQIVEFVKIDIQGQDFFAVLSAGDAIHRLRRVQLEAPIKHSHNDGVPQCKQVLKKMIALGFRLGTAAEVTGWAPLEGAYDTPLMYEGGATDCESTPEFGEVDMFFVRAL